MNTFTHNSLLVAMALGLSACSEGEVTLPSTAVEQTTVQVIELKSPSSQTLKHFNGIISSQNSAGLSFRVAGTIETLLVDEGDFVEKGQLLATLDKHDYQVALEELEAKMLEAKSAHALASNELKRVKQARADDAIASVNLDRAMSAYERSAAMVKVVEKNIQRAQDALRYTELRAPFSGLVGRIAYDEFEQVLPGAAVIGLQTPNALQVEIDVPENLIASIKTGQEATLSWYGSEAQRAAKVTEIAPFPHLIKQTYTVKLALSQPSDELFIGKSVVVSTTNAQQVPAYCLPYSALVGEQDTLHVHLIRDQQVEKRAVAVRSLNANTACVDGQLSAGEQVVVSGTHYLSDGQKVANVLVRAD